jgi:hypothetical protein
MPGLINQAQAAQPVDPQIIQRIQMAAMKALNQPDIEQQIVTLVKSSQDPVQGLAQALLFLMQALYKKSNGTMPKTSVGPAAMQVVGMIAKMCRAAGVLQDVTPQILKQAMAAALQMLQRQAPAQPAAPAGAPNAAPPGAPLNAPTAQQLPPGA